MRLRIAESREMRCATAAADPPTRSAMRPLSGARGEGAAEGRSGQEWIRRLPCAAGGVPGAGAKEPAAVLGSRHPGARSGRWRAAWLPPGRRSRCVDCVSCSVGSNGVQRPGPGRTLRHGNASPDGAVDEERIPSCLNSVRVSAPGLRPMSAHSASIPVALDGAVGEAFVAAAGALAEWRGTSVSRFVLRWQRRIRSRDESSGEVSGGRQRRYRSDPEPGLSVRHAATTQR